MRSLSNYTTEVRFICETLAGYDDSQGFGKVDEIIKSAMPKIFDFDFPIFDVGYKETLCCKILRYHICTERAARKHYPLLYNYSISRWYN